MIRPLLVPRMLALHVAAVVATAAAVLLGLWQYGAWAQGRQDQAAGRVDAAPRPLTSVMSGDSAFPGSAVGQPVRFSGCWLPGSTLYVSGRELNGRRGVWAVTPVAVCPANGSAGCGRASAILVVRGWAPSVRAAPAPPSGAVRLTGWLQPGESADATAASGTRDVLAQLRIADAIQVVDRDLFSGYVMARSVVSPGSISRADGGATTPGAGVAGLSPVTPSVLPKPAAFTSLRNLLYALEWWVFGGFAVYMWWRWCRDEVTRATRVPSRA